MLDKGVSERELNDDEKPWLIMQRNRRVSFTIVLRIADRVPMPSGKS